MDFDPQSGILHMAAHNNALTVGELRTVNLTTGATTLIGQIGAGDHLIDPFAIKGSGSIGNSNWLSVLPTGGGPVAINDSTRLTAYFDATDPSIYNLPGNYFGRIEVSNPGSTMAAFSRPCVPPRRMAAWSACTRKTAAPLT